MARNRARQTRAALAVAIMCCVVGCGSPGPTGDPVHIIVGTPPGIPVGSCYTFGVVGTLVPDSTWGTALIDPTSGNSTPVAWRPGFTAWRVGGDVVVRAPNGAAVATTGHAYMLEGGYAGDSPPWPGVDARVFWACGAVVPQ
jgi:hypothetical protein